MLDKLEEEIAELRAELEGGADAGRVGEEIGDLLFAVVNLARHLKVDAEAALLGPDGRPRAELYAENGLNLNDRGYAVWNEALRGRIEQLWPRP